MIETGNAKPVKAKNVRVSPQTEKEINLQLNQLLANNIVRSSTSPWAAHVILVRKRNQTLRFVVNYRGLNNVTKKYSYPLPETRDIWDKLSGCELYSSLDGASAYWSIPIAEEDREKNSFITPRGQFEFCVMPFGLCNGQATYQRAIDSALKQATNTIRLSMICLLFYSLSKNTSNTYAKLWTATDPLGCSSDAISVGSPSSKLSSWVIYHYRYW